MTRWTGPSAAKAITRCPTRLSITGGGPAAEAVWPSSPKASEKSRPVAVEFSGGDKADSGVGEGLGGLGLQ